MANLTSHSVLPQHWRMQVQFYIPTVRAATLRGQHRRQVRLFLFQISELLSKTHIVLIGSARFSDWTDAVGDSCDWYSSFTVPSVRLQECLKYKGEMGLAVDNCK